MKLGSFLRSKGVSTALLRTLKKQTDGLTIKGERVFTNHSLKANESVLLTLPQPIGFSVTPQAIALDILYNSHHVMAVNKPPFMAVHPTLNYADGTLANAYCGWRQANGAEGAVFHAVGRLDANTSGVQLCAHNSFAAAVVTDSAEKTYLALLHGRLAKDGVLNGAIQRSDESLIERRVSHSGQPSVTRYQRVAETADASLVMVRPQTGRTHQIRVHFANRGNPLVGDTLYGGETDGEKIIERHALHCYQARFKEPQSKPHMVQCSPPEDFMRAAVKLGFKKAAMSHLFHETARLNLK